MSKRNHEWVPATEFKGYFTQDEPGGVTESVSAPVLMATLEAAGFVRGLPTHDTLPGIDAGDILHITPTEKGNLHVPVTVGVGSPLNVVGQELSLQVGTGLQVVDGYLRVNLTANEVPNHDGLNGIDAGDILHVSSAQISNFHSPVSFAINQPFDLVGQEIALVYGSGLAVVGGSLVTSLTANDVPDHDNLNGLDAGDIRHLTTAQLGMVHDPLTVAVGEPFQLTGQELSLTIGAGLSVVYGTLQVDLSSGVALPFVQAIDSTGVRLNNNTGGLVARFGNLGSVDVELFGKLSLTQPGSVSTMDGAFDAIRGSALNSAFSVRSTGDASPRLYISAGGTIFFGLSADVNLYRRALNQLGTDTDMYVGGVLTSAGLIGAGASIEVVDEVRTGVRRSSGRLLGSTGDIFATGTAAASYIPKIRTQGVNIQGYFVGDRVNGSWGIPSALLSGDHIVSFLGLGYYGSGAGGDHCSEMLYFANEDWSATNRGSRIDWRMIPNGSISQVDAMTLGWDGTPSLDVPLGYVRAQHAEMNTWAGNPGFAWFGHEGLNLAGTAYGGVLVQNTGDVYARGPNIFLDPATSMLIKVSTLPRLAIDATGIGVFGVTPVGQQTVTGSRGGNAALASLLSAISAFGYIVDSTTA